MQALKAEEKTRMLRELKEWQFRQQILVPILRSMGFSSIMEYHGSIEKGKDIVFRERDKLGDLINYAAVVSRENILGSVGDSNSSLRMLDPAKMALQEPFVDVYSGKEYEIDRCWIIT